MSNILKGRIDIHDVHIVVEKRHIPKAGDELVVEDASGRIARVRVKHIRSGGWGYSNPDFVKVACELLDFQTAPTPEARTELQEQLREQYVLLEGQIREMFPDHMQDEGIDPNEEPKPKWREAIARAREQGPGFYAGSDMADGFSQGINAVESYLEELFSE